MELFRNTNIDFLGKKWYFLAASLVLTVAGFIAMGITYRKTGNPLPLGVDFRGGTLVYVKFTHPPDYEKIRAALDKAGLNNARIQRYGDPSVHEVLISLDIKETSEAALDEGKNKIINALESNAPPGKQDLNNASAQAIQDYLMQTDPLRAGTDANQRYSELARQMVETRDKKFGGAVASFDQLGVPPAVRAALEQGFYLSDFGVRNVEIVGPQVGKQLQKQALLAVLYSTMGMLAYLWFRFELIYGAAAVAAVIHDTLITLGAFALTQKEISLTVIAAILTLVGYSMNDTIVVFDRIRENVKLMRRESFAEIVNKSINQTLSRTVLTSGLTFLTVLALFLFGGEVLHGFSFALVIGIVIGTYSSIFIAAPMLVAYMDWRARKSGRVPAPAAVGGTREKARAR